MLKKVCPALLPLLLLAVALATGREMAKAASETAGVRILRIHHFLPPQAPTPANFIEPWARKVEKESGGRIKVEIYPAMQLGGKPQSLFDQARDGVVDIVWTLAGYTPGRFPKAEVFELPFLPTNCEATSKAAWDYFDSNLRDEFSSVKVITVHTHTPGLLHMKGKGVRRLEDMRGLKIRGPTRMINRLLRKLGATPVGMPVPSVPEALSRGVIDGTAIPWEVTTPLKIAELVQTHTGFSGDRGLYTAFFLFVMNKASYNSLPDDLQKVIDHNSGRETAAWIGRVMEAGDAAGIKAARDAGNEIIILDKQETARWKKAAQPVVDEWIAEMKSKGIDGAALYQQAKALISKYSRE